MLNNFLNKKKKKKKKKDKTRAKKKNVDLTKLQIYQTNNKKMRRKKDALLTEFKLRKLLRNSWKTWDWPNKLNDLATDTTWKLQLSNALNFAVLWSNSTGVDYNYKVPCQLLIFNFFLHSEFSFWNYSSLYAKIIEH